MRAIMSLFVSSFSIFLLRSPFRQSVRHATGMDVGWRLRFSPLSLRVFGDDVRAQLEVEAQPRLSPSLFLLARASS